MAAVTRPDLEHGDGVGVGQPLQQHGAAPPGEVGPLDAVAVGLGPVQPALVGRDAVGPAHAGRRHARHVAAVHRAPVHAGGPVAPIRPEHQAAGGG